jgi:hypothetical protein
VVYADFFSRYYQTGLSKKDSPFLLTVAEGDWKN